MIKVKCGNCSTNVFDTDNYCRFCGDEAPERDTFECPECTEEVYMEDNFCFNCGTKFEGMEEADEEGEDEHEEESGGDDGCGCGHKHELPHNAPEPSEPAPDPSQPFNPQ